MSEDWDDEDTSAPAVSRLFRVCVTTCFSPRAKQACLRLILCIF